MAAEIFESLPTSKDGLISQEEFIDGLSKLPHSQLKLNSGSWKKAFNSYDKDKNKKIDFFQFLSQVMERKEETDDYCEGLEKVFDMLDKDGSSNLSFQIFKSVFRERNHLLNDQKMIGCWKELLELMDNDGQISFEEFKNGMTTLLEKRSQDIF